MARIKRLKDERWQVMRDDGASLALPLDEWREAFEFMAGVERLTPVVEDAMRYCGHCKHWKRLRENERGQINGMCGKRGGHMLSHRNVRDRIQTFGKDCFARDEKGHRTDG